MARILDEGPGNGYPLFLPAGKGYPRSPDMVSKLVGKVDDVVVNLARRAASSISSWLNSPAKAMLLAMVSEKRKLSWGLQNRYFPATP